MPNNCSNPIPVDPRLFAGLLLPETLPPCTQSHHEISDHCELLSQDAAEAEAAPVPLFALPRCAAGWERCNATLNPAIRRRSAGPDALGSFSN